MPKRQAGKSDPNGPFGQHDYEIVYGPARGRLNRSSEVSIRARRARPLNVGDVFTFGLDDGLWDGVVAEVTVGAGGGWTARCRMMEA
jgi:hypothetical protein